MVAACDMNLCRKPRARTVEVRVTDEYGPYVVFTQLCVTHADEAMSTLGGFRAVRSQPLRYA